VPGINEGDRGGRWPCPGPIGWDPTTRGGSTWELGLGPDVGPIAIIGLGGCPVPGANAGEFPYDEGEKSGAGSVRLLRVGRSVEDPSLDE
jgi:hypothetical protein